MKRLLVCLFTVPFLLASQRIGNEPRREGMQPGYWSTGVKQFFGTSYESYDEKNSYSEKSETAPLSKVWFTGGQGVLTEVFWPTIDAAQVRDSQILVTSEDGFFFEERQNSATTVEWLEAGVPAFKVTNKEMNGRFTITKIIFSDPDRPVVYQHIKIERSVAGLRFFIHHNPAVANTPLGDNALASLGEAPGMGLFAWQDSYAQALLASVGFKKVTTGLEATPSDGFLDLKTGGALSSEFPIARNGNVVLTGELNVDRSLEPIEFDLALGFGGDIDAAYREAKASLSQRNQGLLAKYTSQWKAYGQSVKDLSKAAKDEGRLFKSSVAIMKSMEDKTHAGAFIASPSVPWGLHQIDRNDGKFEKGKRRSYVSGYHIVWPRDLFHMANAFLAINDEKSAIASLNYLKEIQYTAQDGMWEYGWRKRAKDGSFPQNCWIDGDPHWGGLQLDEVAMPILLAAKLRRTSEGKAIDSWDMVRRAADFIADFGPWSPQERWEEHFGVTPSNIAVEIAAMKAASEYAHSVGDADRAARYLKISNEWNNAVESWLFTTSGKHGDGKYFERIEGAQSFDQKWDPNDDAIFNIANGTGPMREKDVIDGGFLELVRFGVRKATAPSLLQSLPEYDATIGVKFENGATSFRRYWGDRYNYDELNNQQTLGMPWPILTGERGHYELALATEMGRTREERSQKIDPYIQAMEYFATPQQMIPEQVWDYGIRAGKPTGAATPLGWAHAEYVRLLRSKLDGKVF